MRVVLALLLLVGPLAPATFAQAFRVATWQVDDLPPAGTPTNTPAVDPERLNEIAAILSSAEAEGFNDMKDFDLICHGRASLQFGLGYRRQWRWRERPY